MDLQTLFVLALTHIATGIAIVAAIKTDLGWVKRNAEATQATQADHAERLNRAESRLTVLEIRRSGQIGHN